MPTAAKASKADRDAAAQILNANIAHFRQVFQQGVDIIGHTQYPDGMAGLSAMDDPNSAAARFRDYRSSSNIERDLSYQDAFGEADKHFTADNEPAAISDWRDDMGTAQADISQWVNVATGYQISTKSQADLDGAGAKVRQDLDKATKDAGLVANG